MTNNAIEVPKDETPAYLEWTLWRAALAIDHMVNKPYEVRGFKLVEACLFRLLAVAKAICARCCDFTILTRGYWQYILRQEAMGGLSDGMFPMLF